MSRLTGVELIAQERQRQLSKGWTPEHDDTHAKGELVAAAIAYAALETLYIYRGTEETYHTFVEATTALPFFTEVEDTRYSDSGGIRRRYAEKKQCDRISELTIAGAFIAAEIDRLQRLEQI